MKRIGFVLLAMLAIAFMMPACTAQSPVTVNVNGYVYSGALPIDGAKVQIFSWDGKNMGSSAYASTTSSDGSNGITGSFVLKRVPYDSSKVFNYVVKAEKDGRTAYAMVHIVPPTKAGEAPKAEPIVLDLSMENWVTHLMGTVQSGNLLANAIGVQNANVTIYECDQTTGLPLSTAKASVKTDGFGKFDIPAGSPNALGYGLYQAVVTANVNGKNYIEKVNFTVYQQETNVNVIMSGVILATPNPTTTPKPSTGGGNSGGFFGIPGFEAVLALAALSGTALYLKKR